MNPDPGTAERRPLRFWLSPVWLIPLVALGIGAWLFYQNVITRGPVIILELRNAEGIRAGMTPVKVRSVEVGRVQELRLATDLSSALAVVQMQPGTAELLVEDSIFWVVKPRIGRRGISGLGTLWSGAYLQMQPGDSPQPARRFAVLEHPPVVPADARGLSIALLSVGSNALSVGDPVLYQGQQVGQIEAAEFKPEAMQMHYRVFIRAPFDQLITTNTQFWDRSGIDFRISSEGVEVHMGSVGAILGGGVTFGVPADLPAGEPVSDGAQFRLYPTHEAARQERFDDGIRYVLLFRDSVRGLSAGAPVEFRGIRVGTVVEVPFFNQKFHLEKFEELRIPVLMAFEPQRLGQAWSHLSRAQWQERLRDLFQGGLRASVRPGNLLTGAKYIGLRFTDETSVDGLTQIGSYAVFPSERSGFDSIQRKLTRLLDKLNGLELEPALDSLTAALAASNATFRQMEETLATLNSLLMSDGAQSLPAQLSATLRVIRETLTAYQGGKSAYESLSQALEQLNAVLEDLAPLARTLRQEPGALLLGREPIDDPVPQAK